MTPLDADLERIALQLSRATAKPIEECRAAVMMAAHVNRVLVAEYRWWRRIERILSRLIKWLSRKVPNG